jgi:nucleoside-diphosphate-sugar epimerase
VIVAAPDRELRATRRVMTGITGFVGGHFALRCARAGHHPIALTRAASDTAARDRVSEALRAAARSLGEDWAANAAAPLVLTADLAQPECGVSGEPLARLRRAQPEQFWHFGASLRYEDKHRDEIFASNLQGTRHALSLAKASGCATFVYVSTAYTAGRQHGAIAERLHDFGAGFNNAYEESKARAEHAVAEFCTREGLKFAILRPSIVIGPYAQKGTGGSTTGLYGFLREVCRIAAALRALGRPVEFRGDPSTLCNLIPVDWFIDDVASLLDEGLRDGGIYHNTCEHPLTIARVGEVVASALDIPGFEIEARATLRSPLEQRLARRTSFYGGYFSNSKQFLRQRPCARELSVPDLTEYVREFLRELGAPTLGSANASLARARA